MLWSRTPLKLLYLGNRLFRGISTSSIPYKLGSIYQFPPYKSFNPCTPFHCLRDSQYSSFFPPFFASYSKVRPFSSDAEPSTDFNWENPEDPVAESISAELRKDISEPFDALSLSQRLELCFSHISLTPSLILRTLNISPDAGRAALGFLEWVKSRPDFEPTDESYSYFVDYFGRRKDFKAADDVLVDGRGITSTKTLDSMFDRLVRAGRPTQAVSFFDKMDKDYGFVQNLDTLKLVVGKLCKHGFASHAEKMVKNLAVNFFPDECICDMMITGWCVDGKLDEARRLAQEMYRGGFEIGVVAYNAILDCVCRLCREKDPFRLKTEAQNVLIEMEKAGVPRNVETFNVLINNLCKVRMTEDAMKLFDRMPEWGCYPNEETFILLIRSLYQAARVGEGDEMIDKMKSAGYGDALNKKEFYGFLKILCGIERIDHAMSIFTEMKKHGCKPGMKTYDLLMGKLCAHGRVDKANALYKEAESNGIPVTPKAYKLDPRFMKKPEPVKKEKKRETLPEKMARKRRTLRKINLSFVKKPRRMMRRA